MYHCEICKKGFTKESFPRHLKAHNIKSKEYYDKFLKQSDEGICGCGKEATFYGIYRGYAKSCSTECKCKYQNNTKIEYWIRKTNGNVEEAEKQLYERQHTLTKEKMGEKEYEEYVKKRSYLSSKEYYVDTYGEEYWEDVKKRSGVTMENMISKYGKEQGTKKYKEWKKNVALTKENLIKKYGKVEGMERYNKKRLDWSETMMKKRKKGEINNTVSSVSKQQIQLVEMIKDNGIPLYYYNENELVISDTDNGYYCLYDITYNNKIIEYNGDYWHCNPNIFESNEKNPSTNMRAKEVWDKDKRKAELARREGYDIMYVWESEFLEDPKSIVDKCIDFLKG
jgi:hypothetical protein